MRTRRRGAFDPSIARVDINFVDEMKHVMIVTSDGRIAGDVQPMVRFNVALPLRARRQPADGALGRRRPHGHGVLRDAHARGAGRRGGAAGGAAAVGDRGAGGDVPGRAGAGDSGILLHEAIGHGLEADFNRKQTSNYTDQVGNLVASELCTVVDDGTIRDSRGSINIDDEGNLPGYNVLIEDGVLRGVHAGPHEREALQRGADRQRPAGDVPATTRCRA